MLPPSLSGWALMAFVGARDVSAWQGAEGHETVQAVVQEGEGIGITGIQLHGEVLLQATFADQLARAAAATCWRSWGPLCSRSSMVSN